MAWSTRSADEERIEILLNRTEVVQNLYEQVRSISITYKSLCEFATSGIKQCGFKTVYGNYQHIVRFRCTL
jgi:hypothetical protein